MLTKKQETFFNLIIEYIKNEGKYLNLKLLKEKSNYKSYNTIYKYFNQLEKKGYIKLNSKKEIIYIKNSISNNAFINIPFIDNTKMLTLPTTFFKSENKYLAFEIPNNKLNSFNLQKGDYVIVLKNQKKLHNKLILVLMNNEYFLVKCLKKDSFYYLFNDKDSFVLTDFIKVIGNVCLSIRVNF